MVTVPRSRSASCTLKGRRSRGSAVPSQRTCRNCPGLTAKAISGAASTKRRQPAVTRRWDTTLASVM